MLHKPVELAWVGLWIAIFIAGFVVLIPTVNRALNLE